ncbi:IclR family transcriptional regulator [Spirillospora sp. NPDC047279]|uniref:IclR family transcriptional regulator n=1 Tax=Spirillospora sp. NPDC047279 TaxID=3155478 RepID=UPI0034064F1F
MASDQSNNQSVERAASVLNAFLAGRPELRVSDVAKATGLGTSTASRLLATLESLDFVERDPISGLYRLGTAPITLGGVALNQHPVHREARQIAQDLAAVLGLGANVAVRRGDTMFYLLNFEGRNAPRSFVLTGQRKPLHATGIGKCLLLALDPAERRAMIPRPTGFTPYTITEHERLDEELAVAAHRGYATEIEELALSRACVAAPIRDASGTIVAAISISGPLSVIDLPARQDELARVVIESADSISVGLGYVGPVGPHGSLGSSVPPQAQGPAAPVGQGRG